MKLIHYPFVPMPDTRWVHTMPNNRPVYLCRGRTNSSCHERSPPVYVFDSDDARRNYIQGALAKNTAIGWIPSGSNFPIERINRAWWTGVKAGALSISIPADGRNPGDGESFPALTKPTKEIPVSNITNTVKTVAAKNKTAATNAAFMEAGRIANKKLSEVASKKLPLMVRGYADTPFGRLAIANVAALAVQQFRPDDAKLATLAQAMTVQAYQELIQQLDIEGMIDGMLDDSAIKRALTKVE